MTRAPLCGIALVLALLAPCARGAEPRDAKKFGAKLLLGTAVKPAPGYPSLAFSGDGKTFAWVTTSLYEGERAELRTKLHVYDLAVDKPLRTVNIADPLTISYSPVALSPDGKSVALATFHTTRGPQSFTSIGHTGLHLWSTADGKRLATLATESAKAPGNGVGQFLFVAFSEDGKQLSAVHHATARRWNIADEKIVAEESVYGEKERDLFHVSPDFKAVALSADRNLGPGGVLVRDLFKKGEPRKLKADGTALAVSRGGRFLAVGLADSVSVWDVAKDAEVAKFKSRPVYDGHQRCDITADGRYAAWVTTDRKLVVADTVAKKEREVLEARAEWVAFSPDGKMLACLRWDRTVLIWDVASLAKAKHE